MTGPPIASREARVYEEETGPPITSNEKNCSYACTYGNCLSPTKPRVSLKTNAGPISLRSMQLFDRPIFLAKSVNQFLFLASRSDRGNWQTGLLFLASRFARGILLTGLFFLASRFTRGNCLIGHSSQPLAPLEAIGGPFSSSEALASLEGMGGPVIF